MGPYDTAHVSQMLQLGVLEKHDLYWHEGMLDWAPVAALNVPQSLPPPVKKTLPTAFDDLPPKPREEPKKTEHVVAREPDYPKQQPLNTQNSTAPKSYKKTQTEGEEIQIKHVIRDIIIIVGLSFIAGIVLGIVDSHDSPSEQMIHAAILNCLVVTCGFFICALINAGNVWNHLKNVAIGVWLFGITNLFFGGTFKNFMLGLPLVFVCMYVGGGIATIIKKMN